TVVSPSNVLGRVAASHTEQIVTSREGPPGAGQDEHTHFPLGRQLLEEGIQLRQHDGREGVQLFRTVQGNGRNGSLSPAVDLLVGHGSEDSVAAVSATRRPRCIALRERPVTFRYSRCRPVRAFPRFEQGTTRLTTAPALGTLPALSIGKEGGCDDGRSGGTADRREDCGRCRTRDRPAGAVLCRIITRRVVAAREETHARRARGGRRDLSEERAFTPPARPPALH